MECKKSKSCKKIGSLKRCCKLSTGQYLSVRLLIYTLEVENKRLDKPNGFFTINVRLDYKCLPVTNAPAYFDKASNNEEKKS